MYLLASSFLDSGSFVPEWIHSFSTKDPFAGLLAVDPAPRDLSLLDPLCRVVPSKTSPVGILCVPSKVGLSESTLPGWLYEGVSTICVGLHVQRGRHLASLH